MNQQALNHGLILEFWTCSVGKGWIVVSWLGWGWVGGGVCEVSLAFLGFVYCEGRMKHEISRHICAASSVLRMLYWSVVVLRELR